jgi:hypothetical protein
MLIQLRIAALAAVAAVIATGAMTLLSLSAH